ncbi:Sjogren's syndrome/scleroderma autoantigen 1 family protein [Methanocaldococcus sp.]
MEKNIRVVSAELLKGAKMLPKHCKNCGFPLFEKNGRIYCPICSKKEKEEIISKKVEKVISNNYNLIVDNKVKYLFDKLKNEEEINRIKEIGEAIYILLKVKSKINERG